MPHKVGDSIRAHIAAQADEAQKREAALKADEAYSDSVQITAAKDAQVKRDLAKLKKPYAFTEDDNSLTVYVPDTTEKGYTTLKPASPDATVEDDEEIPPGPPANPDTPPGGNGPDAGGDATPGGNSDENPPANVEAPATGDENPPANPSVPPSGFFGNA